MCGALRENRCTEAPHCRFPARFSSAMEQIPSSELSRSSAWLSTTPSPYKKNKILEKEKKHCCSVLYQEQKSTQRLRRLRVSYTIPVPAGSPSRGISKNPRQSITLNRGANVTRHQLYHLAYQAGTPSFQATYAAAP